MSLPFAGIAAQSGREIVRQEECYHRIEQDGRAEAGQVSKDMRIEIEYCTGCKWLMRAAWVAQELLSTFEHELDTVSLKPGETGGIFDIRLNGDMVWSRKEQGRFPDVKELKQLVRDKVAPGRDLGHVDH